MVANHMSSLHLSDEEKAKESDVKTKVLVDNTSQGIYKYLEEIENKRDTYSHRWAYELIQNALDSSQDDRKLDLQFILSKDKLKFSHNGRPFRKDEVAHLIYHGSTKQEFDLGKFGTGFLVTHLLSKRVRVSGMRDDGVTFQFVLDRQGSSAEEIKEKTENTWESYLDSLNNDVPGEENAAVYEYLLDEVSRETARAGLNALIDFSSFILVFNNKIQSLRILQGDNSLLIKSHIGVKVEGGTLYGIEETSSESHPVIHELLKCVHEEVEVAIKVNSTSQGKLRIESLNDVPKLFAGLPLIGTVKFPFPGVVNSTLFEPNENRDNLYLGKENTETIKVNKSIIERATEAIVTLIKQLIAVDSVGFENILEFKVEEGDAGYDHEWILTVLRGFVDAIAPLKIVRSSLSNPLKLEDAVFPQDDRLYDSDLERFWEILGYILIYRSRIPSKETFKIWNRVIKSWETSGIERIQERKFALENFCELLTNSENLSKFKSVVMSDVDPIGLLKEFYSFFNENLKNLLDKNVLLNQNNYFVTRKSVFSDKQIEEILKDISKELGNDLRNQLLRPDLPKYIQELVQAKTNEEVLNSVRSLVNAFKEGDEGYMRANLDLFAWLVNKEDLKRLEDFPVASAIGTQIRLLNTDPDKRPLAPKELWNDLDSSTEIFQDEFIISSAYLEKIPDISKWVPLSKYKFLRMTPIYMLKKENLKGDDLEKSCVILDSLDESKEHEFSEKIRLANFAHFNIDNKGIYDSVRRSKEKAKKFIEFLFEYAIAKDDSWFTPISIKCKCGDSHQILPSTWLTKLKQNAWVPTSRNHSEPPTSQNLARLVEDEPRLFRMCSEELPSKFLSKLGVSYVEMFMAIVTKDERSRLEIEHSIGVLFNAFRSRPENLKFVANLAERDPELFLKEIKKSFDNQQLIVRNQETGRLVENLLKRSLENRHLKLTRTGIGSDYAIENDYLDGGNEVILKVGKEDEVIHFLEIKSTHEKVAKITPTQARTATKEANKFVLAVIKLDNNIPTEEEVRNSVRFLFNLGSLVKDQVNQIDSIVKSEDLVTKSDAEIKVEWESGQIRFLVGNDTWEKGIGFEDYVNYLNGLKE